MPTLAEMLPGHAAWMRGNKAAEASVMGYSKDLGWVCGWLAVQLGRPPCIEDLTCENVGAYLNERGQKGAKPTSLNRVVSAVHSLARYLKVPLSLPRARVPRSHPKVLSEAQAEALVTAPQRPQRALRVDYKTEALRLRDRAVLELFYAGGMRLGELRTLRVEKVEFGQDERGRDQALLHVTGKGSKDRSVPCQGPAVAALRAYLDRRGDLRPKDDRVFTSRKTGRGLGSTGLQEIVYRWAGYAEVGHVYPHLLRHTCATHLIRSGVPPPYVMALLGHASLATTTLYTHIAGAELGDRCAARHPRARQELAAAAGPVREVLEVLPQLGREELLQVIQAAAVRLGEVGTPALMG